MLSDEEREALEILKGFEPDDLVECAIYLQVLEKIKNLIEKQSKEIEELKKPKYIINCKTNEITTLTNDFVSKDKIKAKIEEWDKDIKWNNADDHYYAIKMMQSLLEKE